MSWMHASHVIGTAKVVSKEGIDIIEVFGQTVGLVSE